MDWFPHKTIRFCGGPGLNSNGRAEPVHIKVLPSAKHLDAALAAMRKIR